MSSALLNSRTVKAEALRLGFAACGMSPAHDVEESHARFFRRWLSSGFHADMHYMQEHQEMRLSPQLLVPGVQTVISVALPFRPAHPVLHISLYAQGMDYHLVLRERLAAFMQAIGATGRCFVDTAPVLERYWAWRSGLGWIGQDKLLHVPRVGNAVFLGELFVMQQADAYDRPLSIACSQCQLCVNACPQGAITAQGVDARRCLSYLTIEHRGALPSDVNLHDTFYGCDACLMACREISMPANEPLFSPSPLLCSMTDQDWQNLTPQQFRLLFRHSAVKRTKYEGLKRNIVAAFGPKDEEAKKNE